MNKPVIILGNGGHAKVACALLRALGWSVEGVTDNTQTEFASLLPVIGNDDAILTYAVDDIVLCNGLGTMKNTVARMDLYRRFVLAGYYFPTLIHPTASVDESAKIAEGTQIHVRAIIQPCAVIQPNVIINTAAIVEHDSVISAHTHIAPGAVVLGGAEIGEGVIIGANATVLPGIKIGNYATIGAGAVVVKDVKDHAIVKGNPA